MDRPEDVARDVARLFLGGSQSAKKKRRSPSRCLGCGKPSRHIFHDDNCRALYHARNPKPEEAHSMSESTRTERRRFTARAERLAGTVHLIHPDTGRSLCGLEVTGPKVQTILPLRATTCPLCREQAAERIADVQARTRLKLKSDNVENLTRPVKAETAARKLAEFLRLEVVRGHVVIDGTGYRWPLYTERAIADGLIEEAGRGKWRVNLRAISDASAGERLWTDNPAGVRRAVEIVYDRNAVPGQSLTPPASPEAASGDLSASQALTLAARVLADMAEGHDVSPGSLGVDYSREEIREAADKLAAMTGRLAELQARPISGGSPEADNVPEEERPTGGKEAANYRRWIIRAREVGGRVVIFPAAHLKREARRDARDIADKGGYQSGRTFHPVEAVRVEDGYGELRPDAWQIVSGPRFVPVKLGRDSAGWAVLDVSEDEAVRHLTEAGALDMAARFNADPDAAHGAGWESTTGWALNPCAVVRNRREKASDPTGGAYMFPAQFEEAERRGAHDEDVDAQAAALATEAADNWQETPSDPVDTARRAADILSDLPASYDVSRFLVKLTPEALDLIAGDAFPGEIGASIPGAASALAAHKREAAEHEERQLRLIAEAVDTCHEIAAGEPGAFAVEGLKSAHRRLVKLLGESGAGILAATPERTWETLRACQLEDVELPPSVAREARAREALKSRPEMAEPSEIGSGSRTWRGWTWRDPFTPCTLEAAARVAPEAVEALRLLGAAVVISSWTLYLHGDAPQIGLDFHGQAHGYRGLCAWISAEGRVTLGAG